MHTGGEDRDQQEGPGFESGGQPGPFNEFACFPAPAWGFPGFPIILKFALVILNSLCM